jgi:uncharacterized membrane protein YfcA
LRRGSLFIAGGRGQKGARCAATSSPSSTDTPRGEFVGIKRKGMLIGLTMGFFGGMVGQGGGVVATPLMVSTAGLTQHQAHGTSLVAIVSTGLAGALAYYWHGTVTKDKSSTTEATMTQEPGLDVFAAGVLALAASVSAHFGALRTKKVNDVALKRWLAAFMIVSSVSIAAKAWIAERESKRQNFATQLSSQRQSPIVSVEDSQNIDNRSSNEQKGQQQIDRVNNEEKSREVVSRNITTRSLSPFYLGYISLVGAVTGYASGFLGIGGGLIMVPLLTLGTEMTQSQVLGTSLLAMVVPSIIASVTHFRLGNIVLPILPTMIIGSAIGGYAGGKVAVGLTETQQRMVVSATLMTLAIRMLKAKRKV